MCCEYNDIQSGVAGKSLWRSCLLTSWALLGLAQPCMSWSSMCGDCGRIQQFFSVVSLYIGPLMASSSRLHPETMWWRKTTWESTRIRMSEYRIWMDMAYTCVHSFCVTKRCQMHCATLCSDQLESVNENSWKLSSLVALTDAFYAVSGRPCLIQFSAKLHSFWSSLKPHTSVLHLIQPSLRHSFIAEFQTLLWRFHSWRHWVWWWALYWLSGTRITTVEYNVLVNWLRPVVAAEDQTALFQRSFVNPMRVL